MQVVGNRERTPSWFELATAWFDPSRAVLPIDAVFPEGQTTEERNEESAAMMVDSQKEATAAALTELGYDVDAADLGPLAHRGLRGRRASSRRATSSSTANGTPVTDAEPLREIVNDGDGAPDRAARSSATARSRPSR